MRIRTIKPEFFDSPHTAQASAVLRLAYIGLWCFADDTGRGRWNPKELEGAIFPNDDLAVLSHGEFHDFGGMWPPLAAIFGLRRYRVDGREFYDIPSWERHQRVRADRASKLPAYEDGEPLEPSQIVEVAATGRQWPPVAARNRGTGEQGNRGTEVTPSSLRSEGVQGETTPDAEPEPSASRKRSARTTGTRIPDDWTPSPDLIAWTRTNAPAAANDREVERFRDYWASTPGAKGRKTSWDATWRNWARRTQDDHDVGRRSSGYRNQASLLASAQAKANAATAHQQGSALALIKAQKEPA